MSIPARGPDSGTPPVRDVVAAILIREGSVLAVTRPPGKILEGFFEFPGGKAKDGETLEMALARELAEELGVTPLTLRPWKSVSVISAGRPLRLHFFLVREFSGEPMPREGQRLLWAKPDELPVEDFLEADREIVGELAGLDWRAI